MQFVKPFNVSIPQILEIKLIVQRIMQEVPFSRTFVVGAEVTHLEGEVRVSIILLRK